MVALLFITFFLMHTFIKGWLRAEHLPIFIFAILVIFLSLIRDSSLGLQFSARFFLTTTIAYIFFTFNFPGRLTVNPKVLLALSSILYFLGVYGYFWEFTYIFSIFCLFFAFKRNYIFSALAAVLLFSVGQRAGLVALFAYIVIHVFHSLNLKKFLAVSIFGLGLVALSLQVPYVRESRVYSTMVALSYDDLSLAWNLASAEAGKYTYDEFVFGSRVALTDNGDLSAHLRIKKWAKAYSDLNVYSFFFGLGGGYFGKGADSGFIRLMMEQGIFVAMSFYALVYSIFRQVDKLGKAAIIILLVGNLFLDLIQSIYIMSFVGLWLNISKRRVGR